MLFVSGLTLLMAKCFQIAETPEGRVSVSGGMSHRRYIRLN